MSSCALSIVGSAVQQMRLAGPPARTAASFIADTAKALTRLALGWALNTTAFPAESMPMPLQMMVSVGLVVGVIAPMTP